MIIAILIISIAYLWLMIETKWLTIHLPRYYPKVSGSLEAILEFAPLIMVISYITAEVITRFLGINLGKRRRWGFMPLWFFPYKLRMPNAGAKPEHTEPKKILGQE